MANEVALRQITSGKYLGVNTMPLSGATLGALSQIEPLPELDIALPELAPGPWYKGPYRLSSSGASQIRLWAQTMSGTQVFFRDPPITGHPSGGKVYKTERSPIKTNVIRFYYNGIKTFGLDESKVNKLIDQGYLTRVAATEEETPEKLPEVDWGKSIVDAISGLAAGLSSGATRTPGTTKETAAKQAALDQKGEIQKIIDDKDKQGKTMLYVGLGAAAVLGVILITR